MLDSLFLDRPPGGLLVVLVVVLARVGVLVFQDLDEAVKGDCEDGAEAVRSLVSFDA